MKIARTPPHRLARGRRAAAALVIGCLATILLMEASFFLLGKVKPRLVRPSAAPTNFNILCLGNSYTAGTGAPPGHAYCDYLQRRLAEHPIYSKYDARVINLGQRSFNSREILSALPREIERYRPRLILLMTGEPNYWNRAGIEEFLAGEPLSFWRRPATVLTSLARKTGTYRFLSLVFGGFREQVASRPYATLSTLMQNRAGLSDEELGWSVFGLLYPGPMPLLDFEKFSDDDITFAIDKLLPLARGPRSTFTLAVVLGRLYLFGKGDHERAIEWYRRSMAMAPGIFRVDAWTDLGIALPLLPPRQRPPFERLQRELAASRPAPATLANALDGQNSTRSLPQFSVVDSPGPERIARIKEALRFRPADWILARLLATNYTNMGRPLDSVAEVRALLSENPLSNPPFVPGFILWSKRDFRLQAPSVRSEIDLLQADFLRRYPSQKFALEAVSDEKIDHWLSSDIREITRLAHGAQAKLLLQTYPPMRNPLEVRRADAVIQRVAAEDGLPLSDTLAYFNQRFTEGLKRESIYSNDFGPEDSHLNAAGYRELADFLFKSLEQEQLISSEGPAHAGSPRGP